MIRTLSSPDGQRKFELLSFGKTRGRQVAIAGWSAVSLPASGFSWLAPPWWPKTTLLKPVLLSRKTRLVCAFLIASQLEIVHAPTKAGE